MADKAIFDELKKASPLISVGVLTADLMSLGSQLKLIEDIGVKLLHFDVMDGCFCPGLTMGPPFIKAVKTPMLKDVHLMIEEPLEKIAGYVNAGADMITVHVESDRYVHRVLQMLSKAANANDPKRGILRGIALNPGTPINVIEPLLDEIEMIFLVAINPGWSGQSISPSTKSRAAAVKQMISKAGKDILLGIDGGIKKDNIAEVAKMGADIIVTGSAVFDGKAPAQNAEFMINTAKHAAGK